jgi:hypothetical protein
MNSSERRNCLTTRNANVSCAVVQELCRASVQVHVNLHLSSCATPHIGLRTAQMTALGFIASS